MDDRYFSDKNRNVRSEGKDKYIKADYFDESFSLKFKKGQGNAQSFNKERIDDDESFTSFARDMEAEDIDGLFSEGHKHGSAPTKPAPAHRIPQGAPVSRKAAPAHSTSVKAARDTHHTTAERQSGHHVAAYPARVPTGRPVGSVPKKNKKKSKAKAFKIVVAVLLVLIIAVGSFAGYMFNRVNKMIGNVNHDNTIVNDRYLPSDAPASEDVINILLIGSDERAGSKTVKGRRSDTMILLTIDTVNSQLKLTSFLRDSYVSIPYISDDGEEKIVKGKMNSAYSKAGPQGVMDTIEYNFGIDVHNYVSVNFEAFEKIIDLLGGVTVDGVTEKEARFMNREAKTDIKAGSNDMNGYEALWYCRIRKLDSDFYRTQRQRKVLTAVIDKLKTKDVAEILDILDEAFPYITTSISKAEIKQLGMSALTYMGYEMHQQQIPADKTWSDGSVNGSYVIDFDIGENKTLLQDFVYGKAEKTEE